MKQEDDQSEMLDEEPLTLCEPAHFQHIIKVDNTF